MNSFRFSSYALRQFKKFDVSEREKIARKLHELKAHPSLFSVLKPVHDLKPATHRIRIGEYRLLVLMEHANACLILKIAHRREIYR